jgi:septum formation protein
VRLFLASNSPRRREILTNLRIPFVARGADADETVHPGELPAAYLERVARAKLAAAGTLLDAVGAVDAILVADTSVILGDEILGKPGSVDEAEQMIARLAGRTHEVWTRFVVGSAEASPRIRHEETVATKVTFRALAPARIRAYAESGEGTDKAGAYAVQGLGAALVSRIEGSYSNVVGLPACEVVVALEALGSLP